MRHTEPTSCDVKRGKPTTPNPNASPTWGCFPRFLTPSWGSLPDKAESTSQWRIHIPQVCSSLRTKLGGSPGPHMARRTRQGEKKLAQAVEKQEPSCGLAAGQSTAPCCSLGEQLSSGKTNTRRKAKPQGVLWLGLKQNRERLLLAQNTLGECWAQQRGTELRAQPGHGAGTLLLPLGAQGNR